MLILLPLYVLEPIIGYCNKEDVFNLSLVNHNYHRLLKTFTYRNIHVHMHALFDEEFFSDDCVQKQRLMDLQQYTRSLYLYGASNVGGWGIKPGTFECLSSLDNLQALTFYRLKLIKFVWFEILAKRLRFLKKLRLIKSTKEETYLALCKFVTLQFLYLDFCDISGNELGYILRSLPLLSHLYLNFCGHVRDEGMHHIGTATKLTHVFVDACGATVTEPLLRLPKVTHLNVYPLIDDISRPLMGFGILHTMHQLKKLSVDGCPLSNWALQQIGKLPRLEALSMHHCEEGVLEVLPLANLSNLYALDLSYWIETVTDEVVKWLLGILKLKELGLQGCSQLTEQCIPYLLHLNVINLRWTILETMEHQGLPLSRFWTIDILNWEMKI